MADERDFLPKGEINRLNVPTTGLNASKSDVSAQILDRLSKMNRDDVERRARDRKEEIDRKPKFDTSLNKDDALSLRFRIPKKLENLSETDLEEISRYLSEQINSNRSARSSQITRLHRYREAWINFQNAGLKFTHKSQHDEHIPIIFEKGKALHARIFKAYADVEPPFSLRPNKAVAQKVKQDKEDLLRWVVKQYSNRGSGFDLEVYKDIWNFTFDGTSITKHFWARDIRKFVTVKEEPKKPPIKDGKLEFTEREVEEEGVQYDGPMMKVRPFENVEIIGAQAEGIEDADLVVDHLKFTQSEVISLTRQGFFRKKAADRVLQKKPQIFDSRPTTQILRNQGERAEGFWRANHRLGLPGYRIQECYFTFDADKDGLNEELVAWREETTGEILRLTYLDRVSPSGERPFVLKKLIHIPGRLTGIGFGEMLYGLGNTVDYIANQRLDAGTLSMFPWFLYRAGANMPKGDQQLEAGRGLPVDDVNDFLFPRVNGNVNYGFNEEALVGRYMERVSGISELASGQVGGQGVTRTATGAAALVNELNANLDIYLKAWQMGFKKNLRLLDKQVQLLLPLNLEFQVLGADSKFIGKRFIDRRALQFDTDFELTGNTINSNKAIERDTAQTLVATLLNPLFIQSGIVSQQNIYNILKNFLQKVEVRDLDAFISNPEPGGSDLDGRDELNMIYMKLRPPIMMNDRHAEKVAVFEEFENSDEFGLFDEEHLGIYNEVKSAHEGFANALESQQGLGALPQPGVNAPPSSEALLASQGGAPQGVPQQLADLLPQGGGQ